MRPFTQSNPNRYCRLFRPAEHSGNPEKLTQLAMSMKRNETGIPLSNRKGEPMGAGYTYFGQFIDHDLTEDCTALRDAGYMEPNDTDNHRTPYLDLGGLYGDGPLSEAHKHLYEEDCASSRLGDAKIEGEAFDLPLDNNWPQLADPRNTENIIIRQVHAMFLKLHNHAVRELVRQKMPAPKWFVEARRRVQWQYQWLVCHDFLKKICQCDVYDQVVRHGNRAIDWSGRFSIPVEFSQAVFRFGHSMVRADYSLGHGTDRHLVRLHDMFWRGKPGPLDSTLAVDWRRFAVLGHGSMRIDTGVVSPLFGLPDEQIRLFGSAPTPHGPKALAVRTILRGNATRLPSGQQACRALCPGEAIVDPKKPVVRGYDPWAILRELDLAGDTPLWYYVLLEAELQEQEKGLRLGALGSRIIAEVIRASLEADAESFVSQTGTDWQPPPWLNSNGEEVSLTSLFDVANLVGLVPLHSRD
jgi:hypothetical protein